MPRMGCQRPRWAMYVYRMSSAHPRNFPGRLVLTLALLCLGTAPALLAAQADKSSAATDQAAAGKDKPAPKPADDKSALPPLPPEAHAQQSIQLDGKTLHYTVTVGALPVRDGDG